MSTKRQKELAGKHYLVAYLYSHGYNAEIVQRAFRRGTNVVVNGQIAITVLTRFVNSSDQDRDQYIFGDNPPRNETLFYAFVRAILVQGAPTHYQVYIAPSDWVIARSIQLHDNYIRNNPNPVNQRQPYTISPDDLEPFQDNWSAL